MVLAAIIVAAMTTELPECLATALSEHGEQLLDELRLLGAMPQVRLTDACVFDRGNGRVANKRGVICVLQCCGGQLDQKRNGVAGANADNDSVGPALAIARAIASDVGLMALFTQKALLDA